MPPVRSVSDHSAAIATSEPASAASVSVSARAGAYRQLLTSSISVISAGAPTRIGGPQ